jgi:hypothetical protein
MQRRSRTGQDGGQPEEMSARFHCGFFAMSCGSYGAVERLSMGKIGSTEGMFCRDGEAAEAGFPIDGIAQHLLPFEIRAAL